MHGGILLFSVNRKKFNGRTRTETWCVWYSEGYWSLKSCVTPHNKKRKKSINFMYLFLVDHDDSRGRLSNYGQTLFYCMIQKKNVLSKFLIYSAHFLRCCRRIFFFFIRNILDFFIYRKKTIIFLCCSALLVS